MKGELFSINYNDFKMHLQLEKQKQEIDVLKKGNAELKFSIKKKDNEIRSYSAELVDKNDLIRDLSRTAVDIQKEVIDRIQALGGIRDIIFLT